MNYSDGYLEVNHDVVSKAIPCSAVYNHIFRSYMSLRIHVYFILYVGFESPVKLGFFHMSAYIAAASEPRLIVA